jgi:hypothetical protein
LGAPTLEITFDFTGDNLVCHLKSLTESMSVDWIYLYQLVVVHLLTDSKSCVSKMLRVC